MKTRVVVVDPAAPDSEVLAEAAQVLHRGGLVAFPTETVYGLGANALESAAVAGIFKAKGRPTNNPLIVHLASVAQIHEVAAACPPSAIRLAEHFWPGPLTLVLPRGDRIPDQVTAGGSTVAVRVPAHAVAQGLLRAAALPLAAPSANRSTELSPTRAEHVLRGLEGRIDMLLDGGPTAGGIESTVLDVTTLPPRLLRPGLISVSELEAVIGPVLRSESPPSETADALPSPGMMPRHYAPRTPLECVEPEREPQRLSQLLAEHRRVGWLTFTSSCEELPGFVRLCRMPSDPVGYAAQLYAALHDMDTAELDCILVTLPPDDEAWLAIRDRLRRAAAR